MTRVDFEVPLALLSEDARRCRHCNESIVFWVYPKTGNRLVLDVASQIPGHSDKTVRLESHFAHCPNAKSFRRGTA